MLSNRTLRSGCFALLALVAGCADADGASRASERADGEQEAAEARRCKPDAGRDAAPPARADAAVDPPAPAASAIPCAVQKVLETSCLTCHGARPVGVGFSLDTLARFQGPSVSDAKRTMAALALERVSASDPRRRMPPASVDPLSEAARKQLSDWLAAGAPAGEACAPAHAEPDAGSAPPSRGGSGGASNTPIVYDDPDVKCYKLTAYASPEDKSQKYSVPTTPDLYVSFNFKAPWSGTQYIKSIHSVIDNHAVIHHWMLLRQLKGDPERVLENASGFHGDGEMIYSWAPGTNDLWFDPDVGMEIPGGSVMQVENHYNNTTGGPTLDGSGVELCVTPNKPEHVAGMSWLGTDFINGTTASGSCTPQNKEPVHLIMSFPHMHKKGVHMKVDWTHADGRKTVLHDAPFDFEYQRTYLYRDAAIQPGDKLTTSCTFAEPSRFGKGTDEEMCFFFSIHWPAGALARRNLFTQIHGPNACIDQ